MSEGRILCFGSMNKDYVYSVDHIVQPGETGRTYEKQVFFGGKGLNQSIAAARAGAGVYHAGRVGPDGQELLNECRKHGVDPRYVEIGEEDTGHTVIQVDRRGQNSILLYGGGNMGIGQERVRQVLSDFAPGEGDLILLQNEINATGDIAEMVKGTGAKAVLNPSPFGPEICGKLLRDVSWIVFNQVEGEMMTGESEPDEMLLALNERYENAGLVLTLGERGAICLYQGERIFQPSFLVDPVDSTGAGDCFLGYFAAGLVQGLELRSNLKRAAAAAALTVTRRGAGASIPGLEETESFTKSYY